MQYMIIEKFKPGMVRSMYQRFEERGRMLPANVKYINSWISEDVTVCYQLMEADSMNGLQEWINNWNDLVDFEVIPIISSAEAKAKTLAV
jgi:hypothetical protein